MAVKKRKLWAALTLWEECRKQAAKLGLKLVIDGDPEYPIGIASREGDAPSEFLGRFARVMELSDYLDGYEQGSEDRS